MSWAVWQYSLADDGVDVTGSFHGEIRTLRFVVSGGSTGIVTVVRPDELLRDAVAPGSHEQAVLESVRAFFVVASAPAALGDGGRADQGG